MTSPVPLPRIDILSKPGGDLYNDAKAVLQALQAKTFKYRVGPAQCLRRLRRQHPP